MAQNVAIGILLPRFQWVGPSLSAQGQVLYHAMTRAEGQKIRDIRHPWFARGDLNITGLEVALLLNFKESKLAWKRVVGVDPE